MDEKPEAIILQELKSSDAAIELIERLFEVAKPDAVYAEPVESSDYTVITASVLLVSMGAGDGGGKNNGRGGDAQAQCRFAQVFHGDFSCPVSLSCKSRGYTPG